MSSPEDKEKHRKRIKIKSRIAKDLRTPKYKQRVVLDKRGNKHDLSKMQFRDLVEAMQDQHQQQDEED